MPDGLLLRLAHLRQVGADHSGGRMLAAEDAPAVGQGPDYPDLPQQPRDRLTGYGPELSDPAVRGDRPDRRDRGVLQLRSARRGWGINIRTATGPIDPDGRGKAQLTAGVVRVHAARASSRARTGANSSDLMMNHRRASPARRPPPMRPSQSRRTRFLPTPNLRRFLRPSPPVSARRGSSGDWIESERSPSRGCPGRPASGRPGIGIRRGRTGRGS
jgi:hypothetical protein